MAALQHFLFLLLILLCLVGAAVVVDGLVYSPIFPNCSTTGNFTNDSPYLGNLVRLMSQLPPSAIANGGFYSTTAGEPPSKVFALTMCYADRNWTECQNCLRDAMFYAHQVCPFSREVRACYRACVFRYSSRSFFSVADLTLAFNVYKGVGKAYEVSDIASMNSTRLKLMSQLAEQAAGSSRLRLANGSQPYTDSQGRSQVMYGLAQCTRDLNASECTRCLTTFVAMLWPSHPNGTYGAVKGYSCYVVYSVGEALNITIPPEIAVPSSGARAPSMGLLVGVPVSSVLLIICTAILVRFLLRSRRPTAREHELVCDDETLEDEFETAGTAPRRFLYSDLAVATNFFSDKEKLGQGGFGSVYRGYLKDMDLHVAIKRVSKGSQQGRKEYISEVKIISRLRHRNLVQLIGWCHGGGELLLVYELLPNGSLDTHIHNQNNVMSWELRYYILNNQSVAHAMPLFIAPSIYYSIRIYTVCRHEIVLGIGSALQYLHQEWEQCVLHRDIKLSNIMLDPSFHAKLGDFGLARLVDHERQSHTTALAGTMGYMDPHCMLTGSASTATDVFSFGVVVLEVVCGRRPVVGVQDSEEFATMHLVQWVWEYYGRGQILDAADARLNGDFDSDEVERVMVTGLWCAHPDRTVRPSIRQAVNVLRYEAPLPNLPEKMPVALFMPPVGSPSESHAGTSSGGTTGSSIVMETSTLLR
ncbi:hypothetical protein EJB05_55138, partial [Eragrostis curvula]